MLTLELINLYVFLCQDELVSNESEYVLRKRQDIDYNEKRMIKRLYRDRLITPSPCSPNLHPLPTDNPFIADIDEEEDEDDVIAIDDVDDLCFENGNLENDYKIGDINVSQLFRHYQNASINIAKKEGLFIESNVHEILSLSSIFLLPDSHSNTMIDIFGSPLLNEIHRQIASTRQIELNSECEPTFRKVIKQATKESRHKAINLLLQNF